MRPLAFIASSGLSIACDCNTVMQYDIIEGCISLEAEEIEVLVEG
jgi:hypothetical protein